MNEKTHLRGVIPAVITPFDDGGEVDRPALAAQTEYLSSAGVHGFFVAGSTAEGGLLTTRQKRVVFETVRDASGGKQFLCLACIRPSTRQVLEEMGDLADLEPDYLVAVTPFYERVGQGS